MAQNIYATLLVVTFTMLFVISNAATSGFADCSKYLIDQDSIVLVRVFENSNHIVVGDVQSVSTCVSNDFDFVSARLVDTSVGLGYGLYPRIMVSITFVNCRSNFGAFDTLVAVVPYCHSAASRIKPGYRYAAFGTMTFHNPFTSFSPCWMDDVTKGFLHVDNYSSVWITDKSNVVERLLDE